MSANLNEAVDDSGLAESHSSAPTATGGLRQTSFLCAPQLITILGTTEHSGHSGNTFASSTGASGYATESRSGMAPSSYGIGSSYQPGSLSSYANTAGTYPSGQHSTSETIASYIPGTQANAESKSGAGITYGSSGTYASSGYNTGHGEGYIGGSTGETVASYIPGTQANAESKASAGTTYGSSSNYTSTTGHSQEAPKGSGEGYIGGVTGETIASYIPGTQANAESKAIAHDSYGSAESYHPEAPASSGILGSIASVIPGTEAYRETHDTTSTARDPITRGYSSTEPSSNEYTQQSSRGQGYAEKYPGGDSYASAGGVASTVASYVPGMCARLAV